VNKTYDQFVLMGKGANATLAGEVVKSVVTKKHKSYFHFIAYKVQLVLHDQQRGADS